MTARPVSVLLSEASNLLSQAWQYMGESWRKGTENWEREMNEWLAEPGEYSDSESEPVPAEGSPLDRVSKLEQAMVSLAVSVAGLQTLVLQGVSGQQPMTRWQMAQDLDPEGEVELLDGSKIQVKDVPLGEDGMPEEEWAMEHCPCEVHNEKRRRAEGKPADPATGMYL